MFKTLSSEQFRDRIFDILRRKQHWATPYFEGSTITKKTIEISIFIKNMSYTSEISQFSWHKFLGKILLGRLAAGLPPLFMKKKLGGFSLGRPHQELFLQMMKGLGFNRAGFRDVELLAPSRGYREWLNQICQEEDWTLGAAALTIFIKGSHG